MFVRNLEKMQTHLTVHFHFPRCHLSHLLFTNYTLHDLNKHSTATLDQDFSCNSNFLSAGPLR